MVQNIYRLLAIEMITASQALGFRELSFKDELDESDENVIYGRDLNPKLRSILKDFRQVVPLITTDRIISKDMHHAEAFIHRLNL